MMKDKLILILLLFSIYSNFSFGQAYKDSFRSDICNCLLQEKLKLRLTENTYKKCFQVALPNYAAQIDSEIEETDVSKRFNLGQLARRDLMLTFQYELIYSCDVYFEFIESIRISKKLIARENAKESELEQYNKLVAMTPSATAYAMRAEVQFKLGRLKASEEDLKKSIEVNPNGENMKATRKELLLLAWIYEEQERYTEAIALYDGIYTGIYDTKVAIFRAIVDRKSGGTMSNIPVVKDRTKNNSISSANKERIKRTSRRNAKKTSNEVKEKKKKDTSKLRKLFKINQ